jgi:hypothetical protein
VLKGIFEFDLERVACTRRLHDDLITNIIAGLDRLVASNGDGTLASPNVAKDSSETTASDELAIAEQWAATEFEAWDDPQIWKDVSGPAWEKEAHSLGVNLRIAAATVRRTKPQLVDGLKKLIETKKGQDHFFEMLDRILAAQGRFEAFAVLLGSAYARHVIAASVLELDGSFPLAGGRGAGDTEPEILGFGEPEEGGAGGSHG